MSLELDYNFISVQQISKKPDDKGIEDGVGQRAVEWAKGRCHDVFINIRGHRGSIYFEKSGEYFDQQTR